MQGSDSYLETLSKAPERVRRRWLIVGVVTAGLAVTALFLVGPLLQDAEQAPTVREGLELSDDEHDQLDRCLKILRLREGRQDNLLPDDSWHYDAISDTHVIFFKDTRSKNPFAKSPASEGLRRARCHQDGPEYVAHLEPFVLEPQPAQDGLAVLNWGHPGYLSGRAGSDVASITLELVDGRRLPVPLGEHGWFARGYLPGFDGAPEHLIGSIRDHVEWETTDGQIHRLQLPEVIHPYFLDEYHHHECAKQTGCVDKTIERIIAEVREQQSGSTLAELVFETIADGHVDDQEYDATSAARTQCRHNAEARHNERFYDASAGKDVDIEFDDMAEWLTAEVESCERDFAPAHEVRLFRLAEQDVTD